MVSIRYYILRSNVEIVNLLSAHITLLAHSYRASYRGMGVHDPFSILQHSPRRLILLSNCHGAMSIFDSGVSTASSPGPLLPQLVRVEASAVDIPRAR
jgi:hypothetical protein